jgi:tRNA (uracil-5-)-methyltransferase
LKKIAGEDAAGAEHLWGDTHICESLLDLKFKISPEAFFQINTKGAEILYKSIIELAAPSEDSTVLDVCCGTGTIGLCFAKVGVFRVANPNETSIYSRTARKC